MPAKRNSLPRVEYVLVVGPEVVGVFDSRDDAEEWAEAYIDDAPNYKGYLQPPQWYVASFKTRALRLAAAIAFAGVAYSPRTAP